MLQSKTIVLALSLMGMAGCSHITRGLDQAQAGLAKIDQGASEAADKYLQAVVTVKAACDMLPDPDKCMADLGMSPEDLDRICVLGIGGDTCAAGAIYDLDQAYGEAAKAAAKAAEAWGEMQPHLDAAEEAARKAKDGLAP